MRQSIDTLTQYIIRGTSFSSLRQSVVLPVFRKYSAMADVSVREARFISQKINNATTGDQTLPGAYSDLFRPNLAIHRNP
jgi:hypothetical protein